MEEMLITVYKNLFFFFFTILCFIMSGREKKRDDNYNMCPIKKLINKKKKSNKPMFIN